MIYSGALVHGTSDNYINIGADVNIGNYWVLDGIGGLVIEDHVDTSSPAGAIFTHSSFEKRLLGKCHGMENLMKAPVHIGKCTWIGSKVTIQPGVKIGHHCALMPNSVIINDVEPYTMVSGIPSNPVKRIYIDNHNVILKNI